jgi:hypothetical protein
MKVSELRIGNYVEAEGKIGTVTTLAEDTISISVDGYASVPHDVDPIPLTEEWLLKLGFGMESPGFYSYGEEAMADYCYNMDEKTFHEYYPTSDMNCIAKCEYVHQLQNLYFALTGEELTIK